jgi:hypothetical protein
LVFLYFGFFKIFFSFISFHLMFCFYIKYGTHSLDFLNHFLVFAISILSLNILFHFFFLFSDLVSIFLIVHFFIIFLICFFPSILSFSTLFYFFLSNFGYRSFNCFFFYLFFRLSPSLFSFNSFYTRFGSHYFDYYLFFYFYFLMVKNFIHDCFLSSVWLFQSYD